MLASWTPFGGAIEAQTFDWRLSSFQAQPPEESRVAIVDINESSLRALAPIAGRWPWPRAIHAGVIDYLARCRPLAIVYDVQFTEEDALGQYRIGDRALSGSESDDELVRSVARAGNVVLLADVVHEGLESGAIDTPIDIADVPGPRYAPGDSMKDRPSLRLPFSRLRHAAAAIGHNLLQKDPGGVSRGMFPFVRAQGVPLPSLGLAGALLAKRVDASRVRLDGNTLALDDVRVPLRDDGQTLLRFRAAHLSKAAYAIRTYSFFDVLLSEEQARAGQAPAVPASAFEGKIVFVGTSGSGLADVHATAFGGTTPGVYLHATLADNVLSNRFVRETATGVGVAVSAAAAVTAGIAVALLPIVWTFGAVGALSIAVVAIAALAMRSGVWFPLTSPLAAVWTAALFAFAYQYFVEGREKREITRLFGKFVSPDIFQQLVTNPALVRIGGERRDMSVLFSDIRGFTAASEHASPEAVLAQLNEYFDAMVQVLFRHRGTVDKFVGDQVMALFGAPVVDPGHADRAVAAAADMSRTLDRLNSRWTSEGRPALEIGIGINSGEMIAGHVGAESLMSYTVIGDAVNLGARIESLNKEHGTRVLISDATFERLSQPVQTRRVGEVAIKGRRQGVVVHEVLA